MNTRFGLVTLFSVMISGGMISVRAATTNLVPIADTSLQEAFPDLNFGGGSSFVSGGRNQGGRTRTLLLFDIAGKIPAGATINSASLAVTVTKVNGPDSTFELHRVLAAWGEGVGDDLHGTAATAGEATWNHRLAPSTLWATAGGDFFGSGSANLAVGAVGTYTFNSEIMAEDVQMWLDNPGTNVGWLLRSQAEGTAGTIRRFAGRLDTVSPPMLTVDYSVGTSSASPPTLFNLAIVGNGIRFSFNVQSNRNYAVEFKNALTNGIWNVLTNIPALPSDTTLHITNGITGSQRYFRARTP